jgi:hypothetical protein
MYWGGDLVDAAECDYESYRNKGTVCPYCGSAVHLRSSSLRTFSGKQVHVNAYFAHFKTGPETDACEARSTGPQSATEREAMRIAARNQRLKLFNARLWDMFREDRNISPPIIKRIRGEIGGREVSRLLPGIRLELVRLQSTERDLFQTQLEMIRKANEKGERHSWGLFLSKGTNLGLDEACERIRLQQEYMDGCNQRLHLEVCSEVLVFLRTKSGGYCLENLILAALPLLLRRGHRTIRQEDWAEFLRNPNVLEILAYACIAIIAGTHWGEVIPKWTNVDQKIFKEG